MLAVIAMLGVVLGELVTLEPKVLDSDKIIIDTLGVSDTGGGTPVVVVDVSVASGFDKGVKVGELLLVTITDILHELLNVAVSLPEGEEEGVGSEVCVTLALPPNEIVDGGVGEDEGDWEGVGDIVSNDDDDGDCEGDGVFVSSGEILAVKDNDVDGVSNTADCVWVGVGEFDAVTVALSVADSLSSTL